MNIERFLFPRYYTQSCIGANNFTNFVTILHLHDADALQAQSTLMPNANALTETGSSPISLSIPAVNTGGRDGHDATTLRSSVVPGSSALDLVKKKLMDVGAMTVVSSPVPASSGVISSELNGSEALESTLRAPQKENSKEKSKEVNDNGNMSESSSDSEMVRAYQPKRIVSSNSRCRASNDGKFSPT